MTRIGGAYKPTVELEKTSSASDIALGDFITWTSSTDGEERSATLTQLRDAVFSDTNPTGVNPTSGTMPINTAGVFTDSPISYNTTENTLVSTAALQVPAGTIFLGEDVTLSAIGGFPAGSSIQRNLSAIAVTRRIGASALLGDGILDGSEARITIADFQPEQFDFQAQPDDSETLVVAGDGEVAFVFTEILSAMITAHTCRGTSGVCDLFIDITLDVNDNNLTDQQLLALPRDRLLRVADGRRDFDRSFDFNNPSDRNGSNDGNGSSYALYSAPIDLDQGRKVILRWRSADGNPFTIKGATVGGVFQPYIVTDFLERRFQQMTVVDDTITTTDNHWSAARIQQAIDALSPMLPLPAFSAFNVSIANAIAAGTISGTQTFTWSIDNIQNVSGNLTISQDGTNLSTTVDPALGTIDLTITSTTLALGESSTFTISGQDTQSNTFTRNYVVRVPNPHEFLYSGRQTTNNFDTVQVDQLTSVEITGSGQVITVTRATGAAGDFFGILVPADEDLSVIRDTVLQQDITNLFTRTANARQINSINYNSYVLGPLAATTEATYTVTIS